jgi:hypothetical protein
VRASRFAVAAFSALMVSAVLAAGGAPEQLRNKTVTMSWTTSGTATPADGKSFNFTNVQTRIVYVSGAGRPFLRAQVRGAPHSRSGERGPDDTSRGSVHFEGNRLIGVETFQSGARQFIATFSDGFSSCRLAIIDAQGRQCRDPAPRSGRRHVQSRECFERFAELCDCERQRVRRSIAALPVDHVAQRLAIEPIAQVLAKQFDAAVMGHVSRA